MTTETDELPVWQDELFQSRADLWSVDRLLASNGLSSGDDYTLEDQGVRCYFEYAEFVDQPYGVTRLRGFSIRRASFFHITANQKLGRGWFIVDVTPGPNYLRAFLVAEEPTRVPSQGLMEMNAKSATLEVVEKLPPKIAAFYGD